MDQYYAARKELRCLSKCRCAVTWYRILPPWKIFSHETRQSWGKSGIKGARIMHVDLLEL